MRTRPIFAVSMVLLATGCLVSAFLAGSRWTSFSEAAELRRAFGVYRWTLTVPPDADGYALSLQFRSGDRNWESGQRLNVRAGEQYVIYVRRDLHAKQLEYAFLTSKSQMRGNSEDPLSGGSMFVDLPQGECRPGDFLLAGGERVELTGSKTSADRSVRVTLQRDETANP